MKKILFLTSIFFYFVSQASIVVAYDSNFVHQNINDHAEDQSIVDQFIQHNLGLSNGSFTLFNGRQARQWIIQGGRDEDEGTRCKNHFHDPLRPFAEAGFTLNLFKRYTSSLVWAQTERVSEDEGNLASWHNARNYFFHALTTGAEQSFANMFLSLGQITHLLSDKAVPAHVRDDNHMIEAIVGRVIEQQHIEYWASRNRDRESDPVYTNGVGPTANIFAGYQNSAETELAPIPIARLWDSDQYTGDNPEVTLLENVGLAEFTNANFLSESTAFKTYPNPNTDHLTLQPSQIEDPFNPGTEVTRMYWTRNAVGNLPLYRVAGEDFLLNHREELNFHEFIDEYDFYPPLDQNIFQDYTNILIPRAVGYSTALLNYFFRGTLEVTPPSEYIFSWFDGSTTEVFSQISANVRNTSAIIDGHGNSIDEAMGEGELLAIARYRVIPNYAADLSTFPASAEELENVMTIEQNPVRYVDFSYSVSEPVAITLANNNLIPANNHQEYTFTFNNDNSIPIGVTDLSLQIVFRGTLGQELDTAIAVGRVDLNEPSQVVYANSTDQAVINGTLGTGDDIRNDPALAELADLDSNGTFNEVEIGEFFIDPYPMSVQFGFSQDDPAVTQIDPELLFAVNNLPAGRYSRFVVLTDADANNGYWITTDMQRHYGGVIESDNYSTNVGGVYLQENTPWDYTPLEPGYLHRGVRQNRLLGEYFCFGDPCNYLGDQREDYVDLAPFTLEIIP